MSSAKELPLKFVLIGDYMVGKTAFNTVLHDKAPQTQYRATVGADMSMLHREIDSTTLSIYLWDIAGQQRFLGLYPVFFKQANVALVMFDLTNKASFDRVSEFVEHIHSHARVVATGEDIPLVLIGNKCDLANCAVDDSDIEELVEKHNFMLFFKTSALTGENVCESFDTTVQKIYEFYKDRDVATNSIDLRANTRRQGGCSGLISRLTGR